MPGPVNRALAGACLLALMASAPAALAQRGWVDPPTGLKGAPAQAGSAADTPWPDEASRRRAPAATSAQASANPAPPQTAKDDAKDNAKSDPAPTKTAKGDPKDDEPATRAAEAEPDKAEPARRAAARRQARKEAAREAANKRERERERATVAKREPAPSRKRAVASREDRRRVAERVIEEEEEAVDLPAYPARQYEVMRLRTLQFPDGRRMQVLTYPERQEPSFPYFR